MWVTVTSNFSKVMCIAVISFFFSCTHMHIHMHKTQIHFNVQRQHSVNIEEGRYFPVLYSRRIFPLMMKLHIYITKQHRGTSF